MHVEGRGWHAPAGGVGSGKGRVHPTRWRGSQRRGVLGMGCRRLHAPMHRPSARAAGGRRLPARADGGADLESAHWGDAAGRGVSHGAVGSRRATGRRWAPPRDAGTQRGAPGPDGLARRQGVERRTHCGPGCADRPFLSAAGYYLTTWFGALHHIAHYQPDAGRAPQGLSSEARASLRQWHSRRTLHRQDRQSHDGAQVTVPPDCGGRGALDPLPF